MAGGQGGQDGPPCWRRDWLGSASHRLALLSCRAPFRQVTATNVDIASVAPKWHLYTPEEVEEVIARL